MTAFDPTLYEEYLLVVLSFWAMVAGVIIGYFWDDSPKYFVIVKQDPPTQAPPPEAFK